MKLLKFANSVSKENWQSNVIKLNTIPPGGHQNHLEAASCYRENPKVAARNRVEDRKKRLDVVSRSSPDRIEF